ncbi:Crp/Fnr family transcriptional regulator [Niallia sp. 03133]|uniref:Crp/Fnr family transcriptional regulator n=1 Tax=Niallia sp. 03133 TaxID=3458060 RepID=UPI0040450017
MKELKDREQIQSHLRGHRIDSIFNEELMSFASLYLFNEGDFICSQGDPSEYLYIFVKGKIKIYMTSAEGKTLILSFKTPLEVIGDIEYIRGIDIINTVQAVSTVSMVGIPYRVLRKYGSDHAPLLRFLLDIITQKFHVKSNSLSFNLLYPVEVRLASYLLSISFDETDSLFSDELSKINVKDTANFIGTSYRHLNRVIQKFVAEDLIERSKGTIFIKNREGLRKMASRSIYE